MSIERHKEQMEAQKATYPALDSVNSTSKVSIWKLMLYVVAVVATTIEQLISVHKKEIEYLIDNQKRVNLNYYRQVCLDYRDGHTFNSDTLTYTGVYTEEEIETAKIVKRAAVKPASEGTQRFIDLKVATIVNGELVAIEEEKLNRVRNHLRINADTGESIRISSNRADELKLEINVYINTQVLNQNGSRVDGKANQVVETSVNDFFADKNFKFDGELVLSLLEDKIQDVEGILDRSVTFEKVEANYKIPAEWEVVKERYTAYSGYYKIRELKVNYLVKPED